MTMLIVSSLFAGNHSRQDSMEPWEDYSENGPKPHVLERSVERTALCALMLWVTLIPFVSPTQATHARPSKGAGTFSGRHTQLYCSRSVRAKWLYPIVRLLERWSHTLRDASGPASFPGQQSHGDATEGACMCILPVAGLGFNCSIIGRL